MVYSMFVCACFIFYFLGRGRRNQIGDQRPEKIFTPPQHRHLFRRLYQKESTRQRRSALGNSIFLSLYRIWEKKSPYDEVFHSVWNVSLYVKIIFLNFIFPILTAGDGILRCRIGNGLGQM